MKVLLLYPPEQQWPGCIVKPNGSLAYPYLGGALRDIGVEAYVYDVSKELSVFVGLIFLVNRQNFPAASSVPVLLMKEY